MSGQAAPPRIIAGQWRGRKLVAPAGLETRPTAARVRQAAFDILVHAPWFGAAALAEARVLDVFAGTGAFGLEALSRGAEAATFIEQGQPALAALRANVAACKAEGLARVVPGDALRPPVGTPHGLVFFDPPYRRGLLAEALAALDRAGWIAPDAVIVAEAAADEPALELLLLAERRHGRTRLSFCRAGPKDQPR